MIKMPTTYTLKPHADNPPIDLSVTASISRPETSKWLLTYELAGRIESIIFPNESVSGRGSNLWKKTCFEFFVRHPDGEYLECNFSPAGLWSCFSFNSYRRGMRDIDLQNWPKISADNSSGRFKLEVLVDLNGVGLSKYTEARLYIALTIVIKMRDRRLCYYALDFSDGQPDFHHADGFLAV
ncbi:DOMON-like domain-containing protein [Burkholderiales bacterium]|nr:DOMON-like domain-containing protein [Burkholderiales bacterium]